MKEWIPSRKWISGAVTGLLTILGHAIATEAWDKTEWGELVAWAAVVIPAYLIPNDPSSAARQLARSRRENP